MCKFIELPKFEDLKVGDMVEIITPYGSKDFFVIKMTKQHAIVAFNEHSTGRFPRCFDSNFEQLPRDSFNKNKYKVLRDITLENGE